MRAGSSEAVSFRLTCETSFFSAKLTKDKAAPFGAFEDDVDGLGVQMSKRYIEPENLNALAEIFHEAKRRMRPEEVSDPAVLSSVALRILNLAAEHSSPWLILRELETAKLGSHVDARAA